MTIFINHTNHPSEKWSAAQRQAAEAFGEIVDVPFPAIPPEWDEHQVAKLAASEAEELLAEHPAAVLVQGEFTYTYALIEHLRAAGIPALAACSRREAVETVAPDGSTVRTSTFRFLRFRRYGTA